MALPRLHYYACDEQGIIPLSGGSHTPAIDKDAKWRPPTAEDLGRLERLFDEPRLGLDTETKDPDIRELGTGVYRRKTGTRMVGASLAAEDGTVCYLPFGHGDDEGMESFDNLPPDTVLTFLRAGFKRYTGDIVGANLPYDLGWLWGYDVEMPSVHRYYDVQVADPLINELHDRYSLEAIAGRRGLPGKDETALRAAAKEHRFDPKRDLWRLMARHVGPYAEHDALLPLHILRQQEADIARDEITECWDMESRLLPILARMAQRGVYVNQDRLDKIEAWTKEVEATEFAIVKHHTGVDIPVGQGMNAELLARALREAGLTAEQLEQAVGETSTGKESVTKNTLAHIDHPAAQALIRARQVSTIRTTFVNGTRRHIGDDGKIHCTFNQIKKTDDKTDTTSGVAYGRLSASNPNMQNQPGSSRFSGDNSVGPMWRAIYSAAAPCTSGQPDIDWVAFDLKQQEPKWSFHYGAILEERMLGGAESITGVHGALALCQRLCDDPTLDTYDPLAAAAHVPRPTAKIMWLARSYGQGDGTLCRNLGLPTIKITYNHQLFLQAMKDGHDKYAAKAMAMVPIDSPMGQASRSTFPPWDGAGAEGKAIIDGFDRELPFLRAAAGIAREAAEARGYVKLISGRRCHFPIDPKTGEPSGEWTRKAFNRLIQGTAAEQTKRIMIAVCEDPEIERMLLLQVHDELDFGMPAGDLALRERCRDIMRHAVPMKVPTVVDVEGGPTWGESMQVNKKPYVWHLG